MYYTQPPTPVYPSVDQPDHVLVNINPDNPPYVAPVHTDPVLMPYLPRLSATVALNIQNNRDQDPLRMYFFNVAARNNFANPEFTSIVQDAAQYAMYLMYGTKQPEPSVESAIQRACNEMTSMHVARRFCEDSYIREVLTPQLPAERKSNLEAAAATYATIVNLISQMARQPIQQPMNPQLGMNPMSYPQYPQQQMTPQQQQQYLALQQQQLQQQQMQQYQQQMMMQQQGYGNQQAVYNPMASYPQQQPYGYAAPQQQPMGFGMVQQQPTFNSNFAFQNNAYQGPATFTSSVEAMGRSYESPHAASTQQQQQMYNQAHQPAPQPQYQDTPVQQTQYVWGDEQPEAAPLVPSTPTQTETPIMQIPAPTPNPTIEIGKRYALDSDVISWRPSPKQPYMPAFDSRVFKPYLVMHDDGTVSVVLADKEPDMDYEAHATEDVLMYEQVMRAITEEPILDADLTAARNNAKNETPLEATEEQLLEADLNETMVVGDPQTSDSLVNARSEHEIRAAVKDALIYSEVIDVTTGTTGLGPDAYRITKMLADTRSLPQMKAVYENAKERYEPLLNYLDVRATAAVNDYLNIGMGLTDVNIDSFFGDVTDLPAYLRANRGENYAAAFEAKVPTLIRESFKLAALGVYRKRLGLEENASEEQIHELISRTGLVLLSRRVAFTSINSDAKQLGLDITHANVPQAVIATYNKLLHAINGRVKYITRMSRPELNYLLVKDQDRTVTIELNEAAMVSDLLLATRRTN